MKFELVSQIGVKNSSLEEKIKSACFDTIYDLDRLDVAVAYATIQGVKLLESTLGQIPSNSRWVIGLDDAVTQPEALEYLTKLEGSEVRIGKMHRAARFHPKLYCLWSSNDDSKCVSIVGSGNLTISGFRENGEAAAIFTSESISDALLLKQQCKRMWQLGEKLSSLKLQSYRDTYMKAKKLRKELVDIGVTLPDSQSESQWEEGSYTQSGDPTSASNAWLEAGSASAGGRDLEFPKKMMPFFRLSATKETRKFIMGDGTEHQLTFTERTRNQMWRLMFTSEAIRAAIDRDTLRPTSGGNRSDLTIIFQRIKGSNDFALRMIRIDDYEFNKLLQKSRSSGSLERTTAGPGGRRYGFY